ncbi:LysR substrate-binding domain-containing protein [uncultured Sphingomonas sp.]|uniref:LysR substrate-binding domain-containing protein n=1 Tax=uncultured Sphingomonas sp. TaxID=158754 RepID=UPI0035CB406A
MDWPTRADLPGFLAAYPDIEVEIFAEDSFVDVLAAGCDAGIRYDERLEQDMIAVPIGPRVQRAATAAAPAYLDRCGWPAHPRDLLHHACLLGRFSSGALTSPWEFEREGEIVRIGPRGPLIVQVGAATDLAVDAALAGMGIITLFEGWLRSHLDSGAPEPLLEDWWQPFSGRFSTIRTDASSRRRYALSWITSDRCDADRTAQRRSSYAPHSRR